MRKFMPSLLLTFRGKSILLFNKSFRQGYRNLQALVKVMKRKKIKLNSVRTSKLGRRFHESAPIGQLTGATTSAD